MDTSQIYIIIAIVVLAVIAALVFIRNKGKKREKLTPLTSLAFIFIFSGVLFGDNRFLAYGLIGIGVILAVVDIIIKVKK